MRFVAWYEVAFCGLVCAAQVSPPVSSETPTVRINVELVQFDAVVTDAKGAHVAGLKPEDFEILDAGKPQRITNFSYVTKKRDVRMTGEQSQQPSAVIATNTRPEQVVRTVAVVIDDLGMCEQSFLSMREAVRNLVEKQVQPGDLVAIVTTTGKLGALERVTADRRALRAAFARLRSTSTHRQSVLDADFASPCFDNDVREDYYARFSVAVFRRVVDSLRELPGRKSILLFSEGLPIAPLPVAMDGRPCIKNNLLSPGDSLRREYNAFLLHAVRSGVTVNTIDPRELIASFDTVEVEQRKDVRVATPEERYQALVSSQQNLADIAHKTGGITITNDNDLPAAIARVLNEEDGYYLIAYKPSAPPPSEKGAPRVRNVAVRVARPGLKVRFHSSLYADAPEPAKDPAQRLAAAAMSPFVQSGIHMRCASHFWDAGEKTGPVLDTALHIDARDLTFTAEPGERRKAAFHIFAVIFGPEIKPIDTFEKSYTVSLANGAYEKALSDGLVQRLELPLKHAGAHQVRSAVRDLQSDRIGSASEFLEVPDLKQGALALSGIVLQHTESPEPSIQFHRGETVAYAYQVLNAHLAGNRQTDVEVRTELRRGGTLLGASAPSIVDATGQADLKRLVITDQLRLGKQLTPGAYTLQVTAISRNGSRKSAVQSAELYVVD
jgi:VWFA-related protein